MTYAIVASAVVTAFCFYMIGRSITRIRLARVIRRMADNYRREAFALSDELHGEWNPDRAMRIRENADKLLGKAEALCELVDQV